jgi:hypothetical protein
MTRAMVREVDGQLVLDDPDALAMIRAVGKYNCKGLFDLNADRVVHFVKRMKDGGRSPLNVVIVLINVDDVHGGPIAEALMPGHDWQEYRDRGELPVARGLAGREGIEAVLADFDKEAAEKLKDMKGIAVVVVDHGVAEIFGVAQ